MRQTKLAVTGLYVLPIKIVNDAVNEFEPNLCQSGLRLLGRDGCFQQI